MKNWFVAVDLDRCLLDTETFLSDFMAVTLHHSSLEEAQILLAQHDSEKAGGSFDVAESIRTLLSERGEAQQWEKIKDKFKKYATSQQYLMPGADKLLEYLEAASLPWGILTYGGDEWQRFKLTITGLKTYPHFITDSKYKARILEEWLRDGYVPVRLGGVPVSDCILIDDKLVSFKDLPSGAMGILVDMKRMPQGGESLIQVEGLNEVVAELKKYAAS